MHQNVSVCQSVILSCFDLGGRRNKIVYEDLNFPSVMYVYEAHRALGARVVTVQSDDGITVPLERCLAAIDEETLLVPLSHVVFKSGFVQDVAAIVRRAHEVGALVVADLYQSAGTVPVDVAAWDVDFATGGSREVAVRRPRRRATSTWRRACTTRCSRGSRAGWRTRTRSRSRPGAIDYARRRHALPARHARGARALRGAGGLRDRGGDRRRRHPPRSRCGRSQLLMDLAREHGLTPRTPADARAARRHGDPRRARTARP